MTSLEQEKHTIDNFTHRTSEVQEFISNRPSIIIRWGISFFAIMLLVLIIICWFIQYPDIVIAKAKLNSINAPKAIVAREDGKLMRLFVKENEKVRENQVLGYLESLAKSESVLELEKQIDSVIYLINRNRTDEITRFFPDYTKQGFLSDFGELQTDYQTYIQSFITFKTFLSNGFYLRKKSMLLTDLQNIKKLKDILAVQKGLLQQDLSLSSETFNANDSLARDKVISPLDYRNEKSKLITKQLSLPQVSVLIVNNESQENAKEKEIAELENNISLQKSTFVQALLTMKSQITAWEYKYLLIAPASGAISFAGFFQEGQEMKTGTILFYIQPNNTSFFVEVLIPQYNFGKVKPGQQVLLKFPAYPFEQYGSVVGKIEYLKNTTSDSGYLAMVSLPGGLLTNYNKILQYHNGLLAEADIITQNMKLLERFYYNISSQLRR